MRVRTTTNLGLVSRERPEAPFFTSTLPSGSTGRIVTDEEAAAEGLPEKQWEWLVPDGEDDLVAPAVDGWYEPQPERIVPLPGVPVGGMSR